MPRPRCVRTGCTSGGPYSDEVSFIESVVRRLPSQLREKALAHRELLKFGIVGGTTFVVDTLVFFTLKSTVLGPKPVTAKIIATLLATILSYVLNREWSFSTRGGRETRHEAVLFFVVSAVGLAINSVPLWISSYVFDLRVPKVSPFTENVADFLSAQIIGTLLATAFRWWAFRRFVFPDDEAALAATAGDLDEAIALEDELGHG